MPVQFSAFMAISQRHRSAGVSVSKQKIIVAHQNVLLICVRRLMIGAEVPTVIAYAAIMTSISAMGGMAAEGGPACLRLPRRGGDAGLPALRPERRDVVREATTARVG
jgi:hypothetical protein